MKLRHLTLFSILVILNSYACPAQENPLDELKNLIGGIWLVEGEWENGGHFKQEIQYEWGLNKKIIKVKTFGTINRETSEYGLRNEGIRMWNLADESIQFWEFDIFGGITTGTCSIENNNIYYDYEYQGLNLRESWNYIDNNNYEYVVASMKNGKTDQVYQKSNITRQ